MWEYTISNWQPMLLVLLGLIAGTVILNVSEKAFSIFSPRLRKIIFKTLFYAVLLIVTTKTLNLW